MADTQNNAIDLTQENTARTVLLSRPAVSSYSLGLDGSFRLATAVMGEEQIVIYEAVAGSDRYPPGRTMRIVLSLEEMNALIEHYAKHRADLEEQRRIYLEKYNAPPDDFNPFRDTDLP